MAARCAAILLTILPSFTLGVEAQDLKIMVNKKGKVGFADTSGNEVIKCQYESAQPFSDGVAIVTKSGKSGIIDQTGKVILPLQYSQILPWTKDIYMIKSGKQVGLADHKGTVVLEAVYSFISKPNCYGKALLAKGGKSTTNDKKPYMANAKYGIIDNNGKVIIEPKYRGLYEFSYDCTDKNPYGEGMRLLYSYHYTTDTLVTDCSYLGFSGYGLTIINAGVMDGNGKVLLKPGLYSEVMQPQGGMIRYYVSKKKKTLCGFYDIDKGTGFQVNAIDQEIEKIQYWTHADFIGDIAPVNGASWRFIDKKGNTLREGYTAMRHSSTTGLWAAKNSKGTWDVFDDSNADVAPLSGFEDIRFPKEKGDKELFSVKKGDKYGYVDRSGAEAIPFTYDMALANDYDFLVVKKDGAWGMLSVDNNVLVPTEYANLQLPSERGTKHVWVEKADSLYYHFNMDTRQLATTGYKAAANFKNGIALVVPVDMTVDDSPVNRAQAFKPNTPKATIDTLKMAKVAGAFGNLIDTSDNVVMDIPVSAMYEEAVVKEIDKRGRRTLTEADKKNILLYVTRENRSYDLNQTLKEEEWNY